MVRTRAAIAEGEDPEPQRRQAPRRRRGVDRRPRRAPVRRAAARAPARPRGRHAPGERENLFSAWRLFYERLAERDADGARVRGHGVGRRGAARLHRVPRRLVAEPSAVRARARPARAGRAAADVGRGQAQRHVALPRAARRRGEMERCSPGSCPGCPTSCARRSASAPRACRSTPSRPCGCCSTAGCSSRAGSAYRAGRPDRDARGARDAARADRSPARRARGRGAAAAPGRRGAREDVRAGRRSRS